MSKFKGVFTALVTPFLNEKVDYKSLEHLIDQQVKNNIDGFVISGTTGESPTLKADEVKEIFKFVKKSAPGKTLIVGTGTNCTKDSIYKTKQAEKWGADAALVVVPYYNKPPQKGLLLHFKKIAQNTTLPIIMYNVPGRTITGLGLETITSLSRIKNIIGIKEASGNIEFTKEISKACPKDFILLSGDDGTYFDFLLAGGHGVISVASHLMPNEFCRLTRSFIGENIALRAQKKKYKRSDFEKFKPLIDALFLESNPIPVKRALKLMNIISSSELRLPLVEMSEEGTKKLISEMKRVGLI